MVGTGGEGTIMDFSLACLSCSSYALITACPSQPILYLQVSRLFLLI